MRRFNYLILLFLILFSGSLFPGCYGEDIDDLNERVDNVEDRVTTLESLVAGLESIIKSGKLITSVTALTDGSGWRVTFSDSSSIDVKHGEKGAAGDKGETGEKGDPGDNGETGEKGDPGDNGETGDQGPQGPAGDNGSTPFIYIDSEGYWCVNYTAAIPEVENPAERILDAQGNPISAYGKAGQGQSGVDGKDGKAGNYISAEFNAANDELILKIHDGETDEVLETITIPYGSSSIELDYLITSVFETAGYIQFNIYDAATAQTTGYRFGKVVSVPVSIKVATPVVYGLVAEADPSTEYSITVQVSPSDALIELDNIFFDYLGEGVVTRSEPSFTDAGHFEITRLTRGTNEGDWAVYFTVAESIIGSGAEDMMPDDHPGMFLAGPKFDVCVTYNANPASFTTVVGGATSAYAPQTAYSRSTNSFTFSEADVEIDAFTLAFSPAMDAIASGEETATTSLGASCASGYSTAYITTLDPVLEVVDVTAGGMTDAALVSHFTNNLADYFTVVPAACGPDYLKGYTVRVNQTALQAFEEELSNSFATGHVIQLKMGVDCHTGEAASASCHYYYVDVTYCRTVAALGQNLSAFLPVGASNQLAAFDITNGLTALGYNPATISELEYHGLEVQKWDGAWVNAEAAAFPASYDAYNMTQTINEGAAEGAYKLSYKFTVDGVDIVLIQKINVSLPDVLVSATSLAVENGLKNSTSYYTNTVDAEVPVTDFLDADNLQLVVPAAAVNGESYPALTLNGTEYSFAAGNLGAGNILTSDLLQFTVTSEQAQQAALSAALASGQPLDVLVMPHGAGEALARDELAVDFKFAKLTGLTLNTVFVPELNYEDNVSTAVNYTGLFASAGFAAASAGFSSAAQTVTSFADLYNDDRVTTVVEAVSWVSSEPAGDLPEGVEAQDVLDITVSEAGISIKTVNPPGLDVSACPPANITFTIKTTDIWGNDKSQIFTAKMVWVTPLPSFPALLTLGATDGDSNPLNIGHGEDALPTSAATIGNRVPATSISFTRKEPNPNSTNMSLQGLAITVNADSITDWLEQQGCTAAVVTYEFAKKEEYINTGAGAGSWATTLGDYVTVGTDGTLTRIWGAGPSVNAYGIAVQVTIRVNGAVFNPDDPLYIFLRTYTSL